MATAIAVAAVVATARCGGEDHQRGAGGGLQHSERIHCDVPEGAGYNPTAILRERPRTIIV